jgi:hypothetical protein
MRIGGLAATLIGVLEHADADALPGTASAGSAVRDRIVQAEGPATRPVRLE